MTTIIHIIHNERPLLMCGEMVRATLADLKTHTRRVIRNADYWACLTGDCPHDTQSECDKSMLLSCPHGGPGDRLWVRESFSLSTDAVPLIGTGAHLDRAKYPKVRVWYQADHDRPTWAERRWTPSIHMPRWASRINLEIVSVGVERVQDISHEDVLAEGTPIPCTEDGRPCLRLTGKFLPSDYMQPGTIERGTMRVTDAADFQRAHFASLWDSINFARGFGWEMNPWVWSVKFKRVKETK